MNIKTLYEQKKDEQKRDGEKRIMFLNIKQPEIRKYFKDKFDGAEFFDFDDDLHDEVEDFDLVFFGSISGNHPKAESLAKKCKTLNIPFIEYGKISGDGNKVSTYRKLLRNGVPQIPTMVTNHQTGVEKASDKFGFPFIVKGSGGSKGSQVFKITRIAEYEKAKKKINKGDFFVQKLIENPGDWRLYVVDGEVVVSVFRSSQDPSKEFRNNLSLGGTATFQKPPKEVEQLAIKVAKLLERDISGVDIIQDSSTGEYYVMEVNYAPQFPDDTPTEHKHFLICMNAISEFIKRKMK